MSRAVDREPALDFRILGPVEVYDNGRQIAMGGGKQRALLAILLVSPNESVSIDRLIEALWGSDPPSSAANSVHVYVSQLRKTLGDGMLVTRGRAYLLDVDPMQIDAQRFERLVRKGNEQLRGGDADAAAGTLRDALALWRGPALAEFAYDDFAQLEIERLQGLRLAAMEDRIDADLAIGRAAALVPELERLVREHPLRERLRGQLMVAMYRAGRQAQALEVYRDGRRALADELGLDPGPQLQELERQILAQDRSLELDRARPSFSRAPRSRRVAATVLAASAAVLLAVVAAIVIELNRSGSAELASLAPNSVGVIDAESNRIAAQIPTGVRPGQLVAGDGAVWVANLADESISRIDPDTKALVKTISTGFAPTGLAVDDGRVWVAGSDSTLSWIDPQYNQLSRAARLDPSFFRKPPDHPIAVGFGSVWMSDPIGQVNRVDRSTGRIVSQIDVGTGANGIAVGAGSVWVANTEDGTVSRIDPTGVVIATTPVGHGPTGVAFGEGRVWIAVSLDGVVAGIDPETGAVAARVSVGEHPDAVAVGLGAIWVADSAGGHVFRIDPRSGVVTKSIDLGSSPGALAVVGGSLWATVTPLAAPQAVGAAVQEGTLRVEVERDPGVLDPAVTFYGPVQYATCAKLVNYPDKSAPTGSRLVPEVAESMPAVSGDGLRYTFTVRPGFVFSPPSNQPVTAQTFKDTIERTLDRRMKSEGASLLADVVGARAYTAGRAQHLAGVTVRGDKLVVQLTRPAGDLAARLSIHYFCAVPSGTPVDPDGVDGIPMAGPYFVSSHVPGQRIVLKHNPNYGGDRPRGPTEIHYTIGVSRQRTMANVLAGRTDYAGDGVPLGDQPELIARVGPGSPAANAGNEQFFVNPVLGIFYFALNTERPLFADPRLRRAVSYAIDRAALAQSWNRFFETDTFAGGPPTADYLPPGMRVSSKRARYSLRSDAARARSLWDGKRRVAILFTCNKPPCPQQAAILEHNLAAIGIDLVVKSFPVSLLFQRAYEPNAAYDLLRIGWFTDTADPGAMLEPLLRSGGLNNLSRVDDLDRQLDAAAKLTGPARDRAYDQLARQIAEDVAPLVAFEAVTSRDFFSKRVGCQVFNPVYGIDLSALCFR